MFWISCFQQSPGTKLEINFPLKVGRSYGDVILRLYRSIECCFVLGNGVPKDRAFVQYSVVHVELRVKIASWTSAYCYTCFVLYK